MHKLRTGIFAAIGLLALILDAKTGIQGAADGVALCIRSIIPSLLPFFVLSILLTNALSSIKITLLRPIERLLRIPKGSGNILLIGMLGGYPVGAQSISQSYQAGSISKDDAKRMLGFCSNAGPSFLFGIIACKFSGIENAWLLWSIHIISAILVGIILPGSSNETLLKKDNPSYSLTVALHRAIKILALVCGWVILFRVVIAFLTRWILWIVPTWLQVSICGLLELANGCCALDAIENEGLRFIVCSGVLSFGGVCVFMQTASVTGKLGMGQYFPGKILQCCISVLLSFVVQYFLYPAYHRVEYTHFFLIFPFMIIFICLYLRYGQKNSSIPAIYGV